MPLKHLKGIIFNGYMGDLKLFKNKMHKLVNETHQMHFVFDKVFNFS